MADKLAVRLIPQGHDVLDPGGMDEASLECECGEDAYVDASWQTLDEFATWRTIRSRTWCATCLPDRLAALLWASKEADRVVLMRR